MNAKPLKTQTSHILVLDNIRSAHNVGSLFRTADTLGISDIVLCGITPTPIDRFGKINKEIAKTALGAEKTIVWKKEISTISFLRKLKKKDMQIVLIEQSEKSIDYKKIHIQSPTVCVVGNEVDGISKKVLALADLIAEIPLRGKKESLNVSVAGAVALFRMLDKYF